MHRKSLEAADQLKDDNSCASDKEEMAETDKSEGSADDSKINSDKSHQNAQENNNNNGGGGGKEDGTNLNIQQRQMAPGYESRYQPERSSSQLLSNERLLQNDRLTDRNPLPTDPEEFRNNSIACLRAKAQEHQAKLLGFTTDALMLVNSGPRRNLGCDANANSINHHHHQQPPQQHHQLQASDVLNSSDNSSSLF